MEEALSKWPSFFVSGRTFSVYTEYAQKGDTARRTKTVATASRGLAKGGFHSFSPCPAISRGQLTELFYAGGRNVDFPLIAASSWTRLPRSASERLPLYRVAARGNLVIMLRERKHAEQVRELNEHEHATNAHQSRWTSTWLH